MLTLKNAKSAVADAAIAYAPVQTKVRAIEQFIRQSEAEIKKLRRDLRSTTRVSKRNTIQGKIAVLQNEIAGQRKQIPPGWQDTNREFKKLTAQLNASRTKWRRQSDGTYSEIRMMVASIESEAELSTFAESLRQIRLSATAVSAADLLSKVKISYKNLSSIYDVEEALKALSVARRALDDESPDLQKAMGMIDVTLASIDQELIWRTAAKTGFYAELAEFEIFARSNLGLREQDRLTPEQVDIITPCLAQHRNLSLQF